MHASPPCAGAPLRVSPRTCHGCGGFSLVEIATSIGIIAFAFISLIGLLPTGLQVFREAIDSSNETWIEQRLNSMVQVTPWARIEELEKFRFYFDEEGRLTDRTSPDESSAPEEQSVENRIYAVKLLTAKPLRPGDSSAVAIAGGENAFAENVVRVVMVIAPCQKPAAMKEFEKVTLLEDLQKLGKRSGVKTRAFLVTRMDSIREIGSR